MLNREKKTDRKAKNADMTIKLSLILCKELLSYCSCDQIEGKGKMLEICIRDHLHGFLILFFLR